MFIHISQLINCAFYDFTNRFYGLCTSQSNQLMICLLLSSVFMGQLLFIIYTKIHLEIKSRPISSTASNSVSSSFWKLAENGIIIIVIWAEFSNQLGHWEITQVAKFMGPTWGPPGSCRPRCAPWTLLSGKLWARSASGYLTWRCALLGYPYLAFSVHQYRYCILNCHDQVYQDKC